MEVHPPDHPIHTWRDFFIHIATIVVGLLIAIGLEQSVEGLHHRHQRHLLEEDLQAESVRNLRIAVTNMQYLDWLKRVQRVQYDELDRSEAGGRAPVYLKPPPSPAPMFLRPVSAVWNVAQTSATLNLLPRQEAERYAHVYSSAQQAYLAIERLNEANAERHSALIMASSSDDVTGSDYDLSRLSKEERSQFRVATSHVIGEARGFQAYNMNLFALTWGTLHGDSDDENTRNMLDVRTVFDRGGAAAVLARYPIPGGEANSVEEHK